MVFMAQFVIAPSMDRVSINSCLGGGGGGGGGLFSKTPQKSGIKILVILQNLALEIDGSASIWVMSLGKAGEHTYKKYSVFAETE